MGLRGAIFADEVSLSFTVSPWPRKAGSHLPPPRPHTVRRDPHLLHNFFTPTSSRTGFHLPEKRWSKKQTLRFFLLRLPLFCRALFPYTTLSLAAIKRVGRRNERKGCESSGGEGRRKEGGGGSRVLHARRRRSFNLGNKEKEERGKKARTHTHTHSSVRPPRSSVR